MLKEKIMVVKPGRRAGGGIKKAYSQGSKETAFMPSLEFL
jgi:hypothetical protein